MAPTVEILSTERHADMTKTCHVRLLHTTTVKGAPVKSIRYARVLPGALPTNWIEPGTNIKLPEFPEGDWEIVDLVPGKVKGEAKVVDPRKGRILELTAWHNHSVDYFELRKMFQHPFARLCGKRNDSMFLVRHESLMRTAGVMVAFMKIANALPELRNISAELRVYQELEGSGIAPRFIGHVTENGRVVGFLTEYLEDAYPPRLSNFKACATVLGKLHAKGIIHGDAHSGNFLIKSDGTAVLIDFELSRPCKCPRTLRQEMEELQYELPSESL